MDIEVELTDAGPQNKKLSITVPQTIVDARLEAAYRKLAKKHKLPGFRKGKVPLKTLEQRFGSKVGPDVAADLASEALAIALAQHELETIGEPELDLGDPARGEPFRFGATVTLRPHPEVSDYVGVRVAREPTTLSDEALEGHLDAMRQQSGALETSDEGRAAADGDIVDVTLTYSAETYGDLVRKHQLVRLPDDPDHPFVVDLVRGLRPGEADMAVLTIPDDYLMEDWAGRTCEVAVYVHEIKRVKAPPLDDEFARRMGHASVDELREALRSQLNEAMAERGRDREVRRLLEAIVEKNPFEVPAAMVQQRAETLVRNIAAQLTDRMSQAMDVSLDDLEDEKRQHVVEEAEFSVRRELILEAVARQEGIRLDDDERDAGIERVASRIGQPAEVLQAALERGGMPEFEAKLLEDKVVEWLLDRAEIVDEA